MLVLPDNDVPAVVEVLRRVLESDEWADYCRAIGVEFTTFEDHGLARNAKDQQVWETCQAVGAVLVTANRAGGVGSLDETINTLGDAESLPVITVADPQRVLLDGDYAYQTAIQLLDFLERIDTLRGAGRLFVP